MVGMLTPLLQCKLQNFLTIHGKSRFPGLFIWLRDGRRLPVAVPEGCLLLQASRPPGPPQCPPCPLRSARLACPGRLAALRIAALRCLWDGAFAEACKRRRLHRGRAGAAALVGLFLVRRSLSLRSRGGALKRALKRALGAAGT